MLEIFTWSDTEVWRLETRKRKYLLETAFWNVYGRNRYLLVKKQWKHQNNGWSLFKVTKTLERCVFINFEQTSNMVLLFSLLAMKK